MTGARLLIGMTLAWGAWATAFDVRGADLYVAVDGDDSRTCTSETAPCRTIGRAVVVGGASAAAIHVAAGTYAENLELDSAVSIIGNGDVVIDGGGRGSVIEISGNAAVTLRGLTITGGFAAQGGGVSMITGTATMEDCTLSGNLAIATGGAVCSDRASLTMSRCIISRNECRGPGAAGLTSSDTMTLTDCVIAGNVGGQESAIHSGGTMDLERCVIRGNRSLDGAASIHSWGAARLTDCLITDNVGAGVATWGPRTHNTLHLLRCEIRRNGSGSSQGGGLFSWGSEVTVEDSIIADNMTRLEGGGIRAIAGTLTLRRCTVKGNTQSLANASTGGGGLVGHGTTGGEGREYFALHLENTTISGNLSARGGGGLGIGSYSRADVVHCTIVGNSAGTGVGGGIRVFGEDTVLRMRGSIVACNFASLAPDCSGSIESADDSLVSDTSDCAIGSSSGAILDVAPFLEALDVTGGAHATHALLPSSPGLDGGALGGCTDFAGNPVLTDQRGQPRPVDGDCDGDAACDMGAWEGPSCGSGTGGLNCTGRWIATVHEAADPAVIRDASNIIGTTETSPFALVPAAGSLLFYLVNDGVGLPAAMLVRRSGASLLLEF